MILLLAAQRTFTVLFPEEWCGYLKIGGQTFIMLMQICVRPCIFAPLIQSSGVLESTQTKPPTQRGIIMEPAPVLLTHLKNDLVKN